ncbi:hypothetical protein [Streptomyces sp. NPDC007264]|uniref:hypothetical protein n=1 Tax=Streptomyces sp. NPDC007264 TaxID=3364777 RepID=UPI0036DEAAAD
MRLSRRVALFLVAASLVTVLPYEAMSHARVHAGKAADPQPFGAECRVRVTGVDVVAHCHNPYPDTDRVSLHIECDPWWDIDTDTAPLAAGPAMTVRLSGRCWEKVRSAWVSHGR